MEQVYKQQKKKLASSSCHDYIPRLYIIMIIIYYYFERKNKIKLKFHMNNLPYFEIKLTLKL